MGGSCRPEQYWDSLIKQCVNCSGECLRPHIIARCINYCESAKCNARPGHYHDHLLKKCVKCTEVCRHPAECPQHCKTLPPFLTTKKPLVVVTTQVLNSKGLLLPTTLDESTIPLYSLLGLCLVLLFSSLFLALVVFLRGVRTKTSKPGPKEANQGNEEPVVQLGQEAGRPGQNSKDFVTNSSRITEREPSDDSIPTETCVCVHCFPDLKALSHANDRLPSAPFPYYPQAVLHRPEIQNGGRLWAEENLHTPGTQEEAAVG